MYGSLGAVVAFMFFVYLASMVFLFGAEVAAESSWLASRCCAAVAKFRRAARTFLASVMARIQAGFTDASAPGPPDGVARDADGWGRSRVTAGRR